MAVTIQESGGGRSFTIEADNVLLPDSIFMSGPDGAMYEFPKSDTIAALKREFGLVETPETSLLRLLAVA